MFRYQNVDRWLEGNRKNKQTKKNDNKLISSEIDMSVDSSSTQKLVQWSHQKGDYEVVADGRTSLEIEKLNPLRVRYSNAFGIGGSEQSEDEIDNLIPKEGLQWKSEKYNSYNENSIVMLDKAGHDLDICVESLVIDNYKSLPKLSPLAIRERPGT